MDILNWVIDPFTAAGDVQLSLLEELIALQKNEHLKATLKCDYHDGRSESMQPLFRIKRFDACKFLVAVEAIRLNEFPYWILQFGAQQIVTVKDSSAENLTNCCKENFDL
ncbi:hypothetical protein TTRE_0000068701 [Trichuris trichiura]|uniref:Uncharacterized protein n=1 Tax=Trichuris trichiura TaxID=36087 RepID=A0A077YY96_TRITR|nr:hypothetical protein TTRE_0000068701 [Trichuris trichiura]